MLFFNVKGCLLDGYHHRHVLMITEDRMQQEHAE